MEMKYCRRCSEPLTRAENNHYRCSSGHSIFANPAPTAGVYFVTTDLQILLAERGIEPRKGMLDAFGGFVEQGESLTEAVVRELKEELSLEPHEYEPLRFVTSAVGNYPYGGEIQPILSTLFWSRLKTDRELTPADDVGAIRSLPLHSLDLALVHDEDIRNGIRALRLLLPPANKETL